MFRAAANILLLALLAAGGVRAQDESDTFPIDLADAQTLLAEARALSDADGGDLWGKPLYGPIMFVDPATRALVTNRGVTGKGLRRHAEDLYVGRLPETVSLGNTSTEWAGMHWTMFTWPLPAEPTWRGALLMHECFHRIQPRLGISQGVPDNHHLDTADGRTWIRMEWRALARALEAGDPAGEAVTDALVFRAYRRALFPQAGEEERELELNEGLAEYTGLRLSGLDIPAQRERAIQSLRMFDRGDKLVRSFAYASGPPYGFLLDAVKPGWPRRVRRGSDYGVMLARAIRFKTPSDIAAVAHERSDLYGYEELHAEEIERDRVRREHVAELRTRFVDGPVLVFDLSGDINWSFNPNNVEAIDGIGTFYGTMRMSGPWGILDAPGGALLVRTGNGGRQIAVPAPESPIERTSKRIEGPGWTFEIHRRWRVTDGPRAGDLRVGKKRR